MKPKRIMSLLLILIMLVSMLPTAYAVEDSTVPTMVPNSTEATEVPDSTEPTEPTEGPPEEIEPWLEEIGLVSDEVIQSFVGTEDPGAYGVMPFGVQMYGRLSNCSQMDFKQNNGIRQGFHFVDADGVEPWDYMNMLYCLEAGKEFSAGSGHEGTGEVPIDGTGTTHGEQVWYNLSADQRIAIALIIMYGAPTTLWDEEWGLNEVGNHDMHNPNIGYRFATQALVWEITGKMRSAVPPYERTNSFWYDGAVGMCMTEDGTVDHFVYAYDAIVASLQSHNTIPSFTGPFAASAPEIEMTGTTMTLTDANSVLHKFDFTNTDTLSYSKNGNDLTITSNGGVPGDVQSAFATLPDPEASIYELWFNQYDYSKQALIRVTVPASDPVPAYFKLKASSGGLNLIKKTEDGKNLEGWQFGIYAEESCATLVSGPHTSDSDGNISITGLSEGTYYVKELGHRDSAVNALYQCTSTNPQKVTITSGETASVTFQNDLIRAVGKIIKKTNTGANLSGWKFHVYTDAACTQAIPGSPFTTNSQGVIALSLIPGDYYVQEVDESHLYPSWTYDTTVHKLTVTPDGTASVTFQNTQYGYGKIVKKTNTGANLSGWKFNIYSDQACTKLVSGSPFTTDSSGTITVRILPGTYYVREVDESAKYPGWSFDTTVRKVTVKAGETASVTVTNTQMGQIQILKAMPDDGSVAGWEFEIHRGKDDVLIGTFVSGEDGTILTGYLEPGEYQVKELIPEDSLYQCTSPNPQTVTVEPGKTASVSFVSQLIPGQIAVQKVDHEGNTLAGAVFLLEWSEDGTSWQAVTYADVLLKGGCMTEGLKEGTLKAGKTGMVEFTGLHPSLYYRLTEVKAPDGFHLLTKPAYEGKLPVDQALTIQLKVVNVPVFKLPETGSKSFWVMPASLLLCLGTAAGLLFYRRKK